MLKRLRSLFPIHLFYIIEASLVGLFFIQAMRYLIGAIYARIGSASLFPTLDPNLIDPALPGLVEPSAVVSELSLIAYMLALPLVAFLLGRFQPLMIVAVVISAAGRYLMNLNMTIAPDVFGAALAVGGGLLYVPLLIRHRAVALPYAMIFAITTDQMFRAYADTLDPSWSANYLNIQLGLTVFVIILSLITFFWQMRHESNREKDDRADNGLMTFWGGIGFGAILFLQFSLLAMPNAIARRSDTGFYALIAPLTVMATLLPIIPAVRGQARRFVGLFDSGARGWVWMLVTMLFIVIGTRLGGIVAAVALVIAQFMVSMMWWWLYRPRAQKDRNFDGIWVIVGIGVFLILTTFDVFTYEYAYVRNFAEELDVLNPVVPSLLRGFRGLGLAVILLAIFFAIMPMVTSPRRIAWAISYQPRWGLSLLSILLIGAVSVGAVYLSRPPQVRGVFDPEVVRIGTFNINSGFNEFSHFDLQIIADTIRFSGADVVMLQEVEVGRMTSYGVDQVLWLARQLEMDARFFPTNEGLQGLAVLSRIEIVFDDGVLLDSIGTQTGLQRVQILPDNNVITLYNLWLEPLLDTGDAQTPAELEAAQNAQLTQVIGTIAAHHPSGQLGRMIIGGTFNNIPDSDVIRRISALGFRDPFADQQPELSATYRRTGVQARLDYIWASVANNFQPVGSIVINDLTRQTLPYQASDHLLAVVDIRLR